MLSETCAPALETLYMEFGGAFNVRQVQYSLSKISDPTSYLIAEIQRFPDLAEFVEPPPVKEIKEGVVNEHPNMPPGFEEMDYEGKIRVLVKMGISKAIASTVASGRVAFEDLEFDLM